MSAQVEAPLPGSEAARARAKRRGVLLMIAGVSLIATMDLVVKLASTNLGVIQIAWGRYTIQLAVLLVVALPAGVHACMRSAIPRVHLFRALVLLGGNLAFMAALRYLPLAEANVIGFVSPLILTALAYPVLGEPVGLRRALAVVAGFVGVLVVMRPGSDVFGWAALLPLAMALCAATYHVMTPVVRRVEDPAISLYFLSVIAVVMTSALVPWSWIPPSPVEWGFLVSVGLLSAGGHVLMIRALESTPASTLAPFFYCHLVWALIYGHVFFGEFPDHATIAGACLVVASGLYVYRVS